MKKSTGSSILEYSIIIALVAICLLPPLIGLGSNIINNFSELLSFLSDNNAAVSQTLANRESATIQDSKIIVNNPSSKTLQSSPPLLSIDLGSYNLEGVPSDFNSFVETAGAAGGTEKLAQLLLQLAAQAQADGQTQLAEDIRRLANTGFTIAKVQNQIEKEITACNRNETCLDALLDGNASLPMDVDYLDVLPEENQTFKQSLYVGALGSVRYCLENTTNPSCTMYNNNPNMAAVKYVQTLDKIKEDSTISPNIKGLINELSWDIGVLGEDFANNAFFITGGETNWFHDPIKVEETDPITVTNFSTALNMYESYNASKITNFDSALICASGKYNVENQACH